jgi:hypothetical protein
LIATHPPIGADMGGALGVEDFLSGDEARWVECALVIVATTALTGTVLQRVQRDRG